MFSRKPSGPKRQALKKGKQLGQKWAFRPKHIEEIQTRLELAKKYRDLALFNLAIDTHLKARDLVKLRVRDIHQGSQILSRAIVVQRKNEQPVRFEIMKQTWEAISKWIEACNLEPDDHLFPSRNSQSPHISTRQYARIVDSWVASIGLDTSSYGTFSMRKSQGLPDLQEDNKSEGRQSIAWRSGAGEHRARLQGRCPEDG